MLYNVHLQVELSNWVQHNQIVLGKNYEKLSGPTLMCTSSFVFKKGQCLNHMYQYNATQNWFVVQLQLRIVEDFRGHFQLAVWSSEFVL